MQPVVAVDVGGTFTDVCVREREERLAPGRAGGDASEALIHG